MKMTLIICGAGLFLIIGYCAIIFYQFSKVSKGEKIAKDTYTNPQRALMVIDIQRDMTEKGGKAELNIEQTDRVIEKVNSLIETAEQRGWLVVYVRHEFKKNPVLRLASGGALAEGSTGAQIDPRVKIINDNIFVKNIMDAFSNPELDDFLVANQVTDLFITGMDARACVDRAVKAALNRDYEVSVLSDVIATSSDEKRKDKLVEFKAAGAALLSMSRLGEQT